MSSNNNLEKEEIKKFFKIFIDEKGLINLVCYKMGKKARENTLMIELIRDNLFEIFNQNPEKKFKIITDMTPLGKIKSGGLSPQTRKISTEIIRHPNLEKGALVTPSVFIKTIINLIIILVGRSNSIKVFSEKEKALKWLLEE